MNIILRWVITAVAVLITAYVLPGVTVDGVFIALVVAVLLGVINVFLKPIVVILTLPINILTLGLFTFVINAAVVLFVARVVEGFDVSNFWWALLFSLVLSAINAVLHGIADRG